MLVKKRIALVSSVLKYGDKKANILEMENMILNHRKEDIDMFVFAELNIIGGMWKNADNDYINLAEEIPNGESCKHIINLSKKYNTIICAGIVEKDCDNFYITHFLCEPQGYIGKQRKLFPHNPTKKSVFKTGNKVIGLNLFDVKCAILACADFLLPEPTLLAGIEQCSIIISPTDCFYQSQISNVKNLLRTRAMDLGGPALAVFGHSESIEEQKVLAAIVSDNYGNILKLETRDKKESKVVVVEIEIKESKYKWGNFQQRKKFLET